MKIGGLSGITTSMQSGKASVLSASFTPFYTFPSSFSCVLSSSLPISQPYGANFTHLHPFFHPRFWCVAAALPLCRSPLPFRNYAPSVRTGPLPSWQRPSSRFATFSYQLRGGPPPAWQRVFCQLSSDTLPDSWASNPFISSPPPFSRAY